MNDNQFYPTPRPLAEKMANCIKAGAAHILEPSAGMGALIDCLRNGKERYTVDCCEIDSALRLWLKEYAEEFELRHDGSLRIVGDDFLKFETYKHYDAILMNPPFANGDVHLMHAIHLMERNRGTVGGQIICLLNAETIKNPYCESRKTLAKKLEEHNAQITFVQNAFYNAERKTGVEIAFIEIEFAPEVLHSDIYERIYRASEAEAYDTGKIESLEVLDFVKNIVSHFNVEAAAGMELIRQFNAFRPYMQYGNSDSDGSLMNISVVGKSNGTTNQQYLTALRKKYWRILMSSSKIVSRLTSSLQQQYRAMVDELKNYDFSEYNVKTIIAEMNAEIAVGIEEEIMNMFDRLTAEHTWYDECKVNRHYFSGWKTNKAWKIGKKSILPCYGVYDDIWHDFRAHHAYDTLSDIERIFNFLDGNMAEEVDLESTLNEAFKRGQTKDIQLKHFKVTCYKKGTIHITYNDPMIVERFNIFAARKRDWLPPCYGHKSWDNLTKEEQDVIKDFDGKQMYDDVCRHYRYYLSSPADSMKLLES